LYFRFDLQRYKKIDKYQKKSYLCKSKFKIMKKLLSLLTAATLAISIVSCNQNQNQNAPISDVAPDQNVDGSATIQDDNFTDATQTLVSDVDDRHCNMLTPGWGNSLGTVTRGTQEWTISGNGITQIWSDAVTASGCQKTTFNGGTWDPPNFNADCRSNPGFPGDLFSWCAVIRFQDQLCPAPWRVPTREDFRDLDIAMGGTGNSRTDLDFVNSNYITRWGGAFGGNCHFDGTLWNQGSWASYWSQTENDATYGRHLSFNSNGIIYPQDWSRKNDGFSLRCVR